MKRGVYTSTRLLALSRTLELLTQDDDASQSPQSAPANPAARAFQSMFPQLVDAVHSPARFADELFAKELIPTVMLGQMSTLGLSNYDKSRALLISLQSRLESIPDDFEVILSVFESSTALSPGIASRLRQAYHQPTGCDRPPPAAGSHQESPPCQTYAEYLKLVYSRTHDNKWPNNPISSYVNLASVLKPLRITRDKTNAFTRATLHHGIDEILSEKEPIAMEDVLKPLEGQTKVNCVLVEGPPGVGKSTFAWELCQRWDSIPDLKKFSLVVLLRFRDKLVQEAKEIADLFYHPDASIQQAVAKEVCSRNGEGLCLILDGFDEFPSHLRKRSLLVDIIKGKLLPGCTVVITSRPSATADLTSCRVDKRIEVLGFTQKEIEEYAGKFFDSEPQLLEGFHQYRKLNPAIKSMMYIPLNTTIVAQVFLTSGGKPLSHTMTELYVEMAFSILIRYLKENGQDELADQLRQSTKLQDLPSDILSHFLKLGEMAFKGTLNEEVIFDELPTKCKHFGFLNASPELYARRSALSYNFLHKSIQEFFTAFHISQLPPSEQEEIYRRHRNIKADTGSVIKYADYNPFKEVWRFLAGLTGFKGIGWAEIKSHCTLEELFSYLYEAQDVSACDSVLGKMDTYTFKAKRVFDYYAAGWCVAASECRLKLRFYDLESGAEVCEAFSSGVTSTQKVRGSVIKLDLSGTPIKEEDVVHLKELPSSIWSKTSWLDVSECKLDASAMGRVAEFVRIHMVSLKYLRIHDNRVGEGGLVKLFNSLSQCMSLERLFIGHNLMGCADVEALARLISPDSERLKELGIFSKRLSCPEMSPECQEMLMEAVLQPSSLESLAMRDVDVSSAHDYFTLLTVNTNLTSITARSIGPALPIMLEALKDNTSVKTLRIDYLYHSADIAALADMLTTNKYLDNLKIGPAYMTDYGEMEKDRQKDMCLDIINALQLQRTKSLKKLEIDGKQLFTETEKRTMSHEIDPRVVLMDK